jgi:hypothetical protein
VCREIRFGQRVEVRHRDCCGALRAPGIAVCHRIGADGQHFSILRRQFSRSGEANVIQTTQAHVPRLLAGKLIPKHPAKAVL